MMVLYKLNWHTSYHTDHIRSEMTFTWRDNISERIVSEVRLLLLLVIERNKVEETVVVFVTAVHFIIEATAGRQGDSTHYEVFWTYCPIIISTTTSDAACSGLIPIPLATSGSGNDKGGGIGVDGGGGRGGMTSCTHKNNGRSCCGSKWKIFLVLFGHSTNAFSITNQHFHSYSSLCSGATT